MNKQQEFLRRACDHFGLPILLDYEVVLASGGRITAQAWIKDSGPSLGMLVFSSLDEVGDAGRDLVQMGFGYSVFGPPLPGEEFDLASYAEMFADWKGPPTLSHDGTCGFFCQKSPQMDDQTEIRMLKWRCRRGMRELDRLLERWLDAGWRQSPEAERATFLRLLDSEDDRLWRWFLGHEAPGDPALAALVERIRTLPP